MLRDTLIIAVTVAIVALLTMVVNWDLASPVGVATRGQPTICVTAFGIVVVAIAMALLAEKR